MQCNGPVCMHSMCEVTSVGGEGSSEASLVPFFDVQEGGEVPQSNSNYRIALNFRGLKLS